MEKQDEQIGHIFIKKIEMSMCRDLVGWSRLAVLAAAICHVYHTSWMSTYTPAHGGNKELSLNIALVPRNRLPLNDSYGAV